jgi:lipid-A-disaccharide synthase
MERKIVQELIQHELNEKNLQAELKKLLDPNHRAQLRSDYAELRHKLGDKGAATRAAKLMVAALK